MPLLPIRRFLPLLRTRAFLIAAILVVGTPTAWLLARGTATNDSALVARVKRGEFRVMVTMSGKLRARESVQITALPNTQQAGCHQPHARSDAEFDPRAEPVAPST